VCGGPRKYVGRGRKKRGNSPYDLANRGKSPTGSSEAEGKCLSGPLKLVNIESHVFPGEGTGAKERGVPPEICFPEKFVGTIRIRRFS